MEITRVKSDSNGNPRYAVHFLALLTEAESARRGPAWLDISTKYDIALARAKKIGGRKFHNKQFGGGIVFQCYGESDIAPHIARVLADAATEEVQANDLTLSVINDSATYAERQRIVTQFHKQHGWINGKESTLARYEAMLRSESKKPHNKGTKFAPNAFILASHDLHAYMVNHYRESNSGADCA